MHKKNCFFVLPVVPVLLALLCLPRTGLALPPSAPLTFDDLLKRLDSHPALLESIEQGKESQYRASVVSTIPDPMLLAGISNVPANDVSDFDSYLPSSKVLGLRQDIPNPVTLNYKKEGLLSLAELQRLQSQFIKNQLRAALIRALSQKEQLEKQKKYLQEQRIAYQELHNFFRGQVHAGRSSYNMYTSTDADLLDLEIRLNETETGIITKKEELMRLVGDDVSVPLPALTVKQERNEEKFLPVLLAKQRIAIAEAKLDESRTEFYPDFSLTFLYQQREENLARGLDGQDWVTAQVGISLPLWAFSKQIPGYQSAKSGKAKSENTYANAKKIYKQRMNILFARLESIEKNIALMKARDSSLHDAVETLQNDYKVALIPLNNVIAAKIKYFNNKISLSQKESEKIAVQAEINSYVNGV